MIMPPHTHRNSKVQRSVGSKERVDTNGRAELERRGSIRCCCTAAAAAAGRLIACDERAAPAEHRVSVTFFRPITPRVSVSSVTSDRVWPPLVNVLYLAMAMPRCRRRHDVIVIVIIFMATVITCASSPAADIGTFTLTVTVLSHTVTPNRSLIPALRHALNHYSLTISNVSYFDL